MFNSRIVAGIHHLIFRGSGSCRGDTLNVAPTANELDALPPLPGSGQRSEVLVAHKPSPTALPDAGPLVRCSLRMTDPVPDNLPIAELLASARALIPELPAGYTMTRRGLV